MSIRKNKILTFMVVIVLVFSQSLVVFAENTLYYSRSFFYEGDLINKEVFYHCSHMYGYNAVNPDIYGDDSYNYLTFEGESEVVCFSYEQTNLSDMGYIDAYGFISKEKYDVTNICCQYKYQTDKIAQNEYTATVSKMIKNDKTYYYTLGNYQGFMNNPHGNTWYDMYNTMLLFDSQESAINYLETGSLTGLVKGRSKTYEASKVYLNNFDVVYHDSNRLNECYIEVRYNISDYLSENVDNAEIRFDMLYDFEGEWLTGLLNSSQLNDFTTYDAVSLKEYPTGFNIYLNDYFVFSDDYVTRLFEEKALLGDEIFVDASSVSVDGVGLNLIYEITKSYLYLDFTPMIGGVNGLKYYGEVNLLNPSSSVYYSSTPDESGNYTPNGDYKQGDGYYYTDVTTDSQDNDVYNYYYYDNSTHQTTQITDNSVSGGDGGIATFPDKLTLAFASPLVLEGVNINNSSSSSSGGGSSGSSDIPELIIEDDDYTDSSLREDLRDGFGLLDNMDTEQNGDGFLQMTAGFFEHLDGELDDILIFGMSSVVAISILRAVFRR